MARPLTPEKTAEFDALLKFNTIAHGVLVNIAGIEYSFTRGSDLERDGMFLEADVVGTSKRRTVAEIFYSDKTAKFFVSCFEEEVPVELIEYLVAEGRKRLPPVAVKHGT